MTNIDAVKMVRDIRDKMTKDLKGKGKDEVDEHFRKHSEWAFKKPSIRKTKKK